MKRFTAILLTLCLLAVLAPAAFAAAPAQTVEQTVRALGIITGDQNGNLNLDDSVTRAQFAKMMVAASTLQDSVGGLGGGSPFGDVKATHWAAEYIKAAVQAGWLVGYVDGTFRPDGNIKTEEAATAVLRMLGYTQADLPGVYPAPQLAKYRSLGLSDGVLAGQGQAVSRRDCMYLFYNLMTAQASSGKVYASTMGYSVTPAGEIDYASLVESKLKGPFIAQSGAISAIVPFDPLEVYRAGALTESRSLELYDVVYYHERLRTVWVYTARAAGLYTAALPSADSPSSVTVGGVTYQITTTSAAFKLSSMGRFSVGDTVTLLLGRDGGVVEVLDPEAGNAVYYGVAGGKRAISFTSPSGDRQSRDMAVIHCTDGVTREFPLDAGDFTPGLAVRVTVEAGRTVIERASYRPFSGTASVSGTKLGEFAFASNVQILDSNAQGNAVTLFPSRIAGYKLASADIRFCAFNQTGEISHLILNDVTGDLATYGIVTSAVVIETKTDTAIGEQYSYNCTYSYVIDGMPGTYSASKPISVSEGAAEIRLDGKTLAGAVLLEGFDITELAQGYAFSGNRRFGLASALQVYILNGGAYTLAELGDVNDLGKYKLTCYTDSYTAGGHVRVIVAQKR